jgi:hypothetical protein
MPQKTRTAKKPLKRKTKTAKTAKNAKTAKTLKILNRTPTPYPFSVASIVSPTGKEVGAITTSSMAMRAVSHDGKNWHVDTDVNGVKKHADITNPKNLTNSQIMDILAYPAAKQDLKTRLLEEFHNMRQPIIPLLAQRFGEPQIQYKYIYKNGCANKNKPVMLNNLSPLHEAKIVPDSSSEPIHIVAVGARKSIKPLKKGRVRTKSKKNRKPRK